MSLPKYILKLASTARASERIVLIKKKKKKYRLIDLQQAKNCS